MHNLFVGSTRKEDGTLVQTWVYLDSLQPDTIRLEKEYISTTGGKPKKVEYLFVNVDKEIKD